MAGKEKRRLKRPEEYRERFYRSVVEQDDLIPVMLRIKETDLHILASRDVESEARHLVIQYRHRLEAYIASRREFLHSLRPIAEDKTAPDIVKEMIAAAHVADVGPMAAVAGAVAEFVGRDLLELGVDEVIIENGGDIFLKRNRECRVAIFAGSSPLSNKVAVRLRVEQMPAGICTSSGTVGHSLSFGKADSVTVIAPSAGLADALATSIGNEIKTGADIAGVIEKSKIFRERITGVVIIRGEKLGAWGDLELAAM